jgi:hypothetical protein
MKRSPLLLFLLALALAWILWPSGEETEEPGRGDTPTVADGDPAAASPLDGDPARIERDAGAGLLVELQDAQGAAYRGDARLLILVEDGQVRELPVSEGRLTLRAPWPDQLIAVGGGFWSNLTPDVPEILGEETLTLSLQHPEASLRIQAQDDQGRSLVAPEATLAAKGSLRRLFTAWRGKAPQAGADGVIEIDDLPPIDYTVTVRHAGHVPLGIDLDLDEGGLRDVVAELQPATFLSGLVVGPDGPVAGVEVGLFSAARVNNMLDVDRERFLDEGRLPSEIPEEHRATTDAQGRFTMDVARAGRYRLFATHRGYLPAIAPDEFELEAAQRHRATTLELNPGHWVDVLVLDEQRQPIQGASLWWSRGGTGILARLSGIAENRPERQRSTSEEDGRAALGPMPSRLLKLHVSRAGYAQHEQELSLESDAPARQAIEVVLAPGASLPVAVLDSITGQPIPEAELRLVPAAEVDDTTGLLGFGGSEKETNDDGRAVFADLAVGDYRLGVDAPRYSSVQQDFQVVAGVNPELVLRLEAGALLHVQVLDDEDQPIEGIPVIATNLEAQDAKREVTDAEGFAHFDGLNPGQWQVQAIDNTAFDDDGLGGNLGVELKFVELERGAEETIALGGRIPRADVEGHLWRGTIALAGASLAVILPTGVQVAVADEKGFYRFEGMPLGDYIAVVNAGGIGAGGGAYYDSMEVASTGTVVRDYFLPETGLEIVVRDGTTGEALQGVAVSLRPRDGSNISGGDFGNTDAEGVARFPSVIPGEYIAFAGSVAVPFLGGDDRGLGGVSSPTIIVTEGGGVQRVELRLKKGATLRVRVSGSDGEYLRGAHLHYATADGQPYNVVSIKGTNSKGVAELKDLPSGPGRLIVRHPTLGYAEVPVNLAAGELNKQEVTLDSGSLVYVTVLDAEGQPMAGVLCTALDERGAPLSYMWSLEESQATNQAYFSGGEQKLGPLPSGNYLIQMVRPGKPTARHVVAVDGREELHLRLPFSGGER